MQIRFSRRVIAVLVTLLLALLGGTAVTQAIAPLTPLTPSLNTNPTAASNQISFNDQLACQRAVEAVYWQHRIWPSENPTPKPSLDAVLSPAVLQARVEDNLREANALDALWHQPVTGEMLQAEMNRIAAGTRQPEILNDIFAAVGNDPTRIADCLARPALVERLARNWYAGDDRFHGDLEAQARADLAAVTAIADLQNTSGIYQETAWEVGNPDEVQRTSDVQVVDESDWDTQTQQLAGWFGTSTDSIPTGKVSALQEDDSGFFVVAVLAKDESHLRAVTVRWEKQSFDAWWATEKTTFDTTIAPITYDYTLPAITGETADMGGSSWLATPSLPVRINVTAVWTGSEMIVWGGGTFGTGRTSDGWGYNPATDMWLAIASYNAPEPRFEHTAIWTGTEMIVWGGCGAFEFRFCRLNNGGRYNPVTGVWTATNFENTPDARLYHTAVWTGSEMIIWGGCRPASNSSCAFLNSGGRYDPATDTWTATSTTGAPSGRVSHSAVWTDDEMIIWGGEEGTSTILTGARYNPDTDTWITTNTTNAPAARGVHTAIWTGTEMVVWGGCPDTAGCIIQGQALNTGGRYNPATDTWTATSTTNAPSARVAHSAIWTGTEMIVWGGASATNVFYNTGGRYNPATDTWTATSTTNAPSARYGHPAVWTGSLMIIWGGSSGRTGGRYDVATDSWTPTGAEDPNAIRALHAAVWTGSEMLIWGGDDIQAGADDLGRIYNPTTRDWRSMPELNDPFRRDNVTAIWTGLEMIVWGGQNGNQIYNDGGRYNPTADTWTPTSTTNAPLPRTYQTAVWSGSEMLIWGGSGDNLYLNSGGRYNPNTDSWTAMTTTGAPAGRYLFTGVWTGNELVIWGGLVSAGETNTGGRYNPVSNSWAATSTTNSPTARHYHTAVWTGDEMVVWGGVADINNPITFDTGGRYDPVADTWTATSTTNAPEGREDHTAVWTGADMIVWGGCSALYCGASGGEAFATGGEYDPIADAWTPTALDRGTPRGRGQHTAVWAGDRMIVWGGYTDLSTYTNTGGEYFTDAPGNQAPVANGDGYTTPANMTLTVSAPGVLVNDLDPDGDSLTASVVTQPDHGTLTLNSDGSLTYVPDSGYVGNDSFTYRAFDGTANSNVASVSITVAGAGSTPTNTVTATVSPTRTPTGTVVTPSATPSPMPGTLTPTPVIPSATPTQTPAAPTNTPTGTPATPTNTPTGTIVVPSATATGSPVPPSATPTGTITPATATPTGTIAVPTSTPTGTIVAPSPTATATPQGEHFLYLPVVQR